MFHVRESVQEAHPAATAPAERATAPRGRTRHRKRDTWLDRLVAETGLLGIALGFWGLNAWFTVQGFAALGAPFWVGILLHITISKSETYLWHRWREPWYLLALLVAVLIDVGTTLIGCIAIASERLPWVLNGTPSDLLAWSALVSTTAPAWWPNAVGLLSIAILVALSPERMIRHFWRGVRATWSEYGH